MRPLHHLAPKQQQEEWEYKRQDETMVMTE
jgi:hypothetical protein